MKTFLSLGAGVQSSTLALMAACGEIGPLPDAAIFADTGCEPTPVYEWLEKLEKLLPFPVHRVQQGEGLLAHIEGAVKGGRFAGAPFYTHGGADEREGMLKRQCTSEFKIAPIRAKLRELLGLERYQHAKAVVAVQWIGISTDEATRMKPSREKWVEHRWPLIEKRMSRWDCMRWLEAKGFPAPPKSSCTFCPYHSDAEWRWLKKSDPEGWAQAVRIDEMIRAGVRGTTQKLYVHESCVPLSQVELVSDSDRRQISLFQNECEGVCGV